MVFIVVFQSFDPTYEGSFVVCMIVLFYRLHIELCSSSDAKWGDITHGSYLCKQKATSIGCKAGTILRWPSQAPRGWTM